MPMRVVQNPVAVRSRKLLKNATPCARDGSAFAGGGSRRRRRRSRRHHDVETRTDIGAHIGHRAGQFVAAGRGLAEPEGDRRRCTLRIADAHRKIESGGMKGKIAITI